MSEESKQFGAQYDANVYSSYRKDTPTELIEKIIAFLKEKIPEPLDTVVDVGCGNGQSTVILAPYFKRVHGSDVSEAQIEQAKASRSLPNVTYAASPAEKLPFEDSSVQLLTAATALHWFDLDTFLPEARRVLCVNGTMAVYGYLNMKPLLDDPARATEVNELFIEYNKALEAHHVMSRVSLLQNRYKDVKFPFEEVNGCPDVRCCFEGKLPDIVNYVSTWSGYQNFKKVDSKGAEELLDYFRKRLYEIGAACNISPEDPTTLYRNFQLILCRKTKDESVGIMSEESKQFGAQYDANVYSSYRKDTPTELIEKIIAFLKEKVPEPLETALDVGCGNGQSTVILAPYFKRVHGSDVSEAQIEQARASRSLPNVTYAASSAEKLPFDDGSVQLLTAATALHWFDLDTFLPEARRVLCVNGAMAVYGYLNMKPLLDDPARATEIDKLFNEYSKSLEPYAVMSRVSVLQNRYKDVKFPFEKVNRCPDVRCCFEGKLTDIVNYVITWSGYQNFKKVDSKGAEELLGYFKKRLYEIGAACNISPEDPTTLYRNFQLILCRKTKDGLFV